MLNRNTLKTIRFRLTLIYSLIFFVFASVFIVAFNIYLQSQIPKVEIVNGERNFIPRRDYILENLALEQLYEIREHEYEQARKYSVFSVVPLSMISFVLGYIVSGTFLSPIDKLRSEIDRIRVEELGKTLNKESDDEIGKLIDSFNDLSRRLSSSFEAQTRFVQDASHEIKTPLAIIQTNLDTVVDRKSATREDLIDAINTALDGITMLNKLTDDLLDLTEPGEREIEQFNLVELIKGQVSEVKKLASQNGVSISSEINVDEHKFKGNQYALGRAIFNLLDNAIKYSKDSKDPKVNVAVNKVDKKGSSIELLVIDNGPGIPKASQVKIFERFYRVDKSRSRKSGGFGLGLAITKKIIEDHFGRITVESQPGNTQFRIVFPAGS